MDIPSGNSINLWQMRRPQGRGREGEEMKYCSKCGNALHDEAVICPKCGCPVENTNFAAKAAQKAKVASASLLNLIAFVINILLFLFLAAVLIMAEPPEQTDGDYHVTFDMFTGIITDIQDTDIEWQQAIAEYNQNIQKVLLGTILWGLFSVGMFLFGLKLKKAVFTPSGKKLTPIYTICAILAPIVSLLAANNMLALVLCGIGLIFFVPAILQIIAGVKFSKAVSLSE